MAPRAPFRILYLLCFMIAGCLESDSVCKDVLPGKVFKGAGIVFYWQQSQDAQREFYFFPVCSENENIQPDTNFMNYTFKRGISFRLSIMSDMYRKFLRKAKYFVDPDYGNPSKIFYVSVYIEFDRPENSMSLYSKDGKDWNLDLPGGNDRIRLKYFVSDESNLKLIKPLFN